MWRRILHYFPTASLPLPPHVVTLGDDDEMGEGGARIVTVPETTVNKDPPTPPTVSPPNESSSDLERSVVIARLPIDPSLSAVQQVQADYDNVVALTDLIGFPVLPTAVYRMPVANPDAEHNRLTKVLMPTRKHAQLLVKFASRVKKERYFSEVFIRPSIANPEDRPKTPAAGRRSGPRYRNPSQTRDHPRPAVNNASRSRTNSVFSNNTNIPSQDTRRNRKKSHRPKTFPAPTFPQMNNQFTPRPLFDPNAANRFPSQPVMHPFPSQYIQPNPYLSFVSQFGMPPNMGMQGNW